jgi:hypothetical protein
MGGGERSVHNWVGSLGSFMVQQVRPPVSKRRVCHDQVPS